MEGRLAVNEIMYCSGQEHQMDRMAACHAASSLRLARSRKEAGKHGARKQASAHAHTPVRMASCLLACLPNPSGTGPRVGGGFEDSAAQRVMSQFTNFVIVNELPSSSGDLAEGGALGRPLSVTTACDAQALGAACRRCVPDL